MGQRMVFPLTAVVGQADVKQALLIALTNPGAGGVLIAGEKGTAKSSMVRALVQVIPDQELIELPLNATEDMIFGTIDLEYAVAYGAKVFAPGILARAHKQLLYVDEINLLRREVLTGILDTADRGVNVVEREGVSHRHESRFTLIGTMNPEEGTLPASVLDRFGLFAVVNRENDVTARAEIVRRVLAYEKAPELFCEQYEAGTRELINKLQTAKKLLDEIKAGNNMIALAAQYCAQANTAGHRSGIFMIEAAKAIAALAGRDYLLPVDLERAAFFVLPHRLRQKASSSPQEQQQEQAEQTSEQQSESNENEVQSEPPSSLLQQQPDLRPDIQEKDHSRLNEPAEKREEPPKTPSNIADQDRFADIDQCFSQAKMAVDLPPDRLLRQGGGKRSHTRAALNRGRYVRSCLPHGRVTDLAFDATLRAAAPYQRLREKGKCCMTIQAEDLRQKVREKRIGNTFLFVVDASGSMGARERMRAVKGAVFAMLQDAYEKRDQVGLIAFRRQTAEVLLPVTRSVDLAQQCLQHLPTGGKTPLAEGLRMALLVLQSLRKRERELLPILVLITDGRANYSVTEHGDAIADALQVAGKIKMAGVHSVVVDTETDFIKLGVARRVALTIGATYYHLQELSGPQIIHIIKNLQLA
jgi:magnesium chelatase subunit D